MRRSLPVPLSGRSTPLSFSLPSTYFEKGTLPPDTLLELRCRFLDRFGDLEKLPLLSFLYLDTDADSHGYFSNNTLVLADLFALFNDGKTVPRFGMVKKERNGFPFYEYQK